MLTAPGVRPSFRPITRVGVLPLARVRSCLICVGVQGLPVFRVDFEIFVSNQMVVLTKFCS